MGLQNLVALAFQVSIAATVFGFGLHARPADLHYMLRQPRLLAVSLLAMFVVVPTAALAIQMAFPMDPAARVAIIALALSAVPPLLPRKELRAGGREDYAIGLTLVAATLSIALTPALVGFLGRLTGRPFEMGSGRIATLVIGLLVVPLFAGIVVKRLVPGVAARLEAPILRAADVLFWGAIVLLLAAVMPELVEFLDPGTVAGVMTYFAVALAIGHVMGGPEPDRSVVLALACASRHPAIAITIATAMFPGHRFGTAVVLCVLLNEVATRPYLHWQKRQRDPARTKAPRHGDLPAVP